MGSTGSGNFSDYSGSRSSGGGDGQGGSGGSSGEDRCQKAFHCTLEEVALCDFYANTGTVPNPGAHLTIILQSRPMAVDTATGDVVGALPTSLNYIAGCMNEGFSYEGTVVTSTNTPVPTVTADFTAL